LAAGPATKVLIGCQQGGAIKNAASEHEQAAAEVFLALPMLFAILEDI
jgi:hypothetical protein